MAPETEQDLRQRIRDLEARLGAAEQTLRALRSGEAKDGLRRGEEIYRAIGESIDYGVWVCAPDGRNIYASESFLRLVGLTQQECSDFGWGDVLHPDDAGRTIAAWKECVRTQGTWDIEHRYRGVDGQWYSILARGVPVHDERGEVVYWAGINLDITDRKKVELELRRSNEELAQFASIISHDLRSPLNAITSFAEQLREEYQDKLEGEADLYLAYLTGAADRMRRLITDLMAYSQIADGGGGQAGLVDCGAALQSAQLNLQGKIRESGAIITHDPLPAVVASAGLLGHVFQNLIENAIKFRCNQAPRIHVSAQLRDQEWIFRVSDNGIGIAPQHLGQVFRIFKRLHGDRYEGTGIGLAMCKRIVERQGGRIWVESTPGQGSSFCFTLPAKGT